MSQQRQSILSKNQISVSIKLTQTKNRATYNSSPLFRYHQQKAKQATQRDDKPVDVERVNEEIRTEEDNPSANRKASKERERRDASYMANLKQADYESNDEAP